MNEYIKLMAEIDFFNLILAIATVASAVIVGKELIEKFCKTLGIEFSWIRRSRERSECEAKIKTDLEALAKNQENFEKDYREDIKLREKIDQEMISSIDSLKKDVKVLSEDIDRGRAEDRFKKLKFNIINSANRIVRQEVVSEELIKRIYDDISEYNELHEKYGFENNQAPASMAVITAKYQEMLMAGNVVKEEELK